MAESKEGIVIGTRTRLAIQVRPGTAVRSSNHAKVMARGSPMAREPRVNNNVFKSSGKVAGLLKPEHNSPGSLQWFQRVVYPRCF